MPNESTEERNHYDKQFLRVHERLDAIQKELSDWRVNCERKHAHDQEVVTMIGGNGHPPLSIRLDRLENADPKQAKPTAKWAAIVALMVAGSLFCGVALTLILTHMGQAPNQ